MSLAAKTGTGDRSLFVDVIRTKYTVFSTETGSPSQRLRGRTRCKSNLIFFLSQRDTVITSSGGKDNSDRAKVKPCDVGEQLWGGRVSYMWRVSGPLFCFRCPARRDDYANLAYVDDDIPSPTFLPFFCMFT